MFNNASFDTKKYIVLLLIVCFVFFIIVIKAFEYLPIADNDIISSNEKLENINVTNNTENQESEAEVENVAAKEDPNHKHVHIDFFKPQKSEIKTEENIEEIQAPSGVDYEEAEKVVKSDEPKPEMKPELSAEEKAVQALYKGQQNYINGEYSTALQEFRSVTQLSNDSTLVASAYEGISQVYAANRKYGTALSFASKAYSISPSSSREMLLARLYYKTGDIEKATKRVNNILHRDFTKN